MAKVIITGANGFLGQHLTLFLAKKNYDVIAASRGECRIPRQQNFQYYPVDLTDFFEVTKMITSLDPEIIIHTAAMSKPDECNKNREECIRQNVTATKNIIASVSSSGIFLIYISTDFVFGENGPHGENDKKNPLNFYGETKLQAEKVLETSGVKYAVVRPVFIYGKIWEGLRGSFLHWVKKNLEEKKKIKVVSDQQRTPTFVTDICTGIEIIAVKGLQGIYHLAGKDILSPYEMAVQTAEYLKLDTSLIENVTSESFYEPVQRAKKSGLKIDKAVKDFDYNPVSFEEGIKESFK